MKTTRTGASLSISLDGAIGESTALFTLPLDATKEVILDLGKVTYINSIGVRQWILWTMKIPRDCMVKMMDCPFVFASQASMVMGFLTQNMTIESLRLPYSCENCGFDDTYVAVRGRDYEYPPAVKVPPKISVPDRRECKKCKTVQLEPDFFIEKTFKFLG